MDGSTEAAGYRGRVLLVEDEPDVLAYVARLLRETGWVVTAVADAESAEPLLAEHDLLLCDIMLPGQDGIAFTRSIRARSDAARWMPVILLTARAASSDVVEGLLAGADDYVTKPFEEPELLARVATHVELALMRRIVIDDAGQRAEHLERALASNRTIGTAIGILMAGRRITSDEAFSLLRERSQHSNRRLREVAEDVIYTGTLSD
jgi:DNA-binding response OmpR family regulator